MSAICKVPLNDPKSGASDQWELVTPNPQPEGTVTLTLAGGTDVLSVQPVTGSPWQTRPQGSAGAYEKAAINGNVIVYSSADPKGKLFTVAYLYLAVIPNQ